MQYKTKPEILNDPAVKYFSENLKRKISSNLRRLILFGSRARGTAVKYSDYDFVIIVNSKDKKVEEEIFEVEYDFLNKYDVPVFGLVYSPDDWSLREHSSFGLNVIKEGIDLL